MTSINTLVGAVVTALRAIESLAIALDAPSSIPEGEEEPVYDSSALIHGYTDEYAIHRSLGEAVSALPAGQILVGYLGLNLGARGGIGGIVHQLAVYINPIDEDMAQDVIDALMSGKPGTSPVSLPYAQISGLDPMDAINISRSTNTDGIDYWQMTFGLAEVWG